MSLKVIVFSYLVCCIYILQTSSQAEEVTDEYDNGDEEYSEVYIENPFVLRVVDPFEEYVDYPAALINNETVVTFSISGDIDGAIVCTAADCQISQRITTMEMYGDFMFWTIKMGADYQPLFFFDKISSNYTCTVAETEAKLFALDAKDMYYCEVGCRNRTYDVLMCDNRLAGFITKEDDTSNDTVKFYDIKSVMDSAGYTIEDESQNVLRDHNITKPPVHTIVFNTSKIYKHPHKKATQRKSDGDRNRVGLDFFLYFLSLFNFLGF